MAENVYLKVNPETMDLKAGEIEGRIQKIEQKWKSLYQKTLEVAAFWEGESSDAEWKDIRYIQDDMEQILKRLREHPSDLRQMAGIYKETEKGAAQVSSALKAGFIS